MASSPTSSGATSSSTSSSPAPTRIRRTVGDILADLSDSDSEIQLAVSSRSKPSVSEDVGTVFDDNESSEEDFPVGGGRLAGRLAGMGAPAASKGYLREGTGPESQSQSQVSASPEESISSISHDVIETSPQPQRKFLLKRKRSSEDEHPSVSPQRESVVHDQERTPTPVRSTQPSPREGSLMSSARDSSSSTATGKSRFQILVEKARKEREAKEAAEEAKRAARAAQESTIHPQKQRQRGSSPADDDKEDSDQSQGDAAKRLTKAARPARKASKKALEEMKADTQRLARNMQLAHQARTKKKFTMETFVMGFGVSSEAAQEPIEPKELPRGPHDTSSSSDIEMDRLNSTPPTSPLRSPALNKVAQPTVTSTTAERATGEGNGSESGKEDHDTLEDIFASRRVGGRKSDKAVKRSIPRAVLQHDSAAVNFVHENYLLNDSDSDIEVVYGKGDKRKYAAFENLPKRKAKETQSHLALRNLAHVRQQKDGKSNITQAQMGPSLLMAARRQAADERKEKIAKLRAAGVIIQTAEEKERDQAQLEDLVEKARQEDEQIRKREKELAKKAGTYVKDVLDEEDSDDEDEDFQDGDDIDSDSGSDGDNEEADDEDENEQDENQPEVQGLFDDAAEDGSSESASEDEAEELVIRTQAVTATPIPISNRARKMRIVVDDDEGEDTWDAAESPVLPKVSKTPQSILRSNRKIIPGLQHSDELPIGLTQAFAATMADTQTQIDQVTQEQDSMDILRDLPSPHISMAPRLNRLESLDMIDESVPATQTQPLNLDFGLSQSQRVPESPNMAPMGSQVPFELTQDAGYSFSPFAGNRFAETPRREPHSTEETIILPNDVDSPILQRRGRLQRGRQADEEADVVKDDSGRETAFHVMHQAARQKVLADFNKKKSEARRAVDEAAEESDDEYAGLGGASDEDSNDEENEDDRQMIDEDTQVGEGDGAKLAKLHADREREADAAAVNKMMKDITTGALRRKRGAGDDLDLSDEEDAANRRREAKRREFARMRKELLKDEAVGKIAEDRKKQAFLKSMEDRDDEEDDEVIVIEPDQELALIDTDSQEQTQQTWSDSRGAARVLQESDESRLNQGRTNDRRTHQQASRRPGTLAEIRESVSFLIEEPDSHPGNIDLGLSDSEDEPEAYVDLDRHFREAEAEEEAMNDENADLGDFVVDDEDLPEDQDSGAFKKPELPKKVNDRAPFSERRTKASNVVDRLDLLRQASSSSASGSSASSKMAFFTSKAGSGTLSAVPSLLRRATTNSSLGSMSGRDTVSATGVVTSKTERGSAAQEKDFVRKGASNSRNAVNYQGRQSLKEEKMSARAGIMKKQQRKKTGGFLTGLFRGDTWA